LSEDVVAAQSVEGGRGEDIVGAENLQRPLQDRLASAADLVHFGGYMWRADALGSLDFTSATQTATDGTTKDVREERKH